MLIDLKTNTSPSPDISYDCGEWQIELPMILDKYLLKDLYKLQVTDMNFPVVADAKGRRLVPANYKRKLHNEKEIQREKLVYLVSKKNIFCLCYRLF